MANWLILLFGFLLGYSMSSITKLFVALSFCGAILANSNNAFAQEIGSLPQSVVDLQQKTYDEVVSPALKKYCMDCHSEGTVEGNVRFDLNDWRGNRELWHKALKNLQANLMPPKDSDPIPAEAKKSIVSWIKNAPFESIPLDPYPGKSPIRRLNRNEYRNTIRELTGVEFNAEVVFPPDDSGFGFDNAAEAMSLSPLLLEKYLQAAKTIVQEAVPTQRWSTPSRTWNGREWVSEEGKINAGSLRHDRAVQLSKGLEVKHSGEYRLLIREKLHGSFDFHPGRYRIICSFDGKELFSAEYKWEESKEVRHEFLFTLAPGSHDLSVQLETIKLENPDEQIGNDRNVTYQLASVTLEGPLAKEYQEHPQGYGKFFHRSEPPEDPVELKGYAREILSRFATRAFRRPPSPDVVDRLIAIAESVYVHPGSNFEEGIQRAFMAVLTSPRFLFRMEDVEAIDSTSMYPKLDEYSLATRLSYLFWSSMPDDRLFELAEKGKLRANLKEEISRMLQSERSKEFIKSFAGQWLRARDVEHVSIDPIAALGFQKEYEQLRSKFAGRFRRGGRGETPIDPESEKMITRFRELNGLRDRFDAGVRTAMRQETEMAFEYVVRDDRSLLELIDANYVFVNEKLGKLYGLDDVRGNDVRKVDLPAGSPRGGVLTQGTMLTVTSNPTRTSPVKRGLFILDNILGTPAPPAPPNVPALEDAANRFGDREPSLRELLTVHREAPLCSSCHSRMDPLGLALENFNAIGMYRELENDKPVDCQGELITGEKFASVQELKKILTTSRRRDYYRCVTEKFLIYALGRGLEYYDEETIEQIVDKLDEGQGRFSLLLDGAVQSAPFQRRLTKKQLGVEVGG